MAVPQQLMNVVSSRARDRHRQRAHARVHQGLGRITHQNSVGQRHRVAGAPLQLKGQIVIGRAGGGQDQTSQLCHVHGTFTSRYC